MPFDVNASTRAAIVASATFSATATDSTSNPATVPRSAAALACSLRQSQTAMASQRLVPARKATAASLGCVVVPCQRRSHCVTGQT